MRLVALIVALATPALATPAKHGRIAQQPRATHAPQVRYPAVSIFGAHVGEALAYRPLDGRGRSRSTARAALEHLLRCRQTGQHHKIDPRLAEALYRVGLHYAGHRLEIFSGYRPRAFCDRAHSRHMSGAAVDFHVEGIDNRALVAYLRKTFHPAGVGYYPHDPHVHLDLQRAHDTFWVQAPPPAGDPGIDAKAGPLAAADDLPLHEVEAPANLEADGDDDGPAEPPVPLEAASEPPSDDPLIDPMGSTSS